MTRWWIAVAVCLLCCLPATAGVVGGDHDEYGFQTLVAVERAPDGDWVVVERPLQREEGRAVVYEHDGRWRSTGTHHALNTTSKVREWRVVDVHPTGDGGWYVLTSDGLVHRYTGEWEPTGTAINLTRRSDLGHPADARALDRGPDGDWWILAGGRVIRYGPAFDRVQATTDGVGGGTLHVDRNGDLWTVTPGVPVARYAPRSDGEGLAVGDGYRPAFHPGSPPHAVDVVTTPDGGFWVATADGTVQRYTVHGVHTGDTHEVGSGQAVASYPSDVINILGVLVVAFVRLFVWLLPLLIALAAGVVALVRKQSPAACGLAVTSSVVLSYGFLYQPYPLRDLVPPVAFVGFVVGVPALSVAVPVALSHYRGVRLPYALAIHLPPLFAAGAMVAVVASSFLAAAT